MGRLDGKVALITGAARGQGRSHALALAAEGASVVAADIAAPIGTVPYALGTPEDLAETIRLVEEHGVHGLAIVADVRDSGQVQAMVDQTLEAFGRVDILVANAGVLHGSPIENITDTAWRDVLDTNLTGTFWCLHAVLPPMREQGFGRVVATSSGMGRGAAPNLAHYTASKWGIIGVVKAFALETAAFGITANVVAPGAVRTQMSTNDANIRLFCPDIENPTIDDMVPRMAAMNPLRIPWVEPEVISKAVLYLVCDEGFTTGTVLEVNLGTSASNI